jgi:hypothetical protein
MGTLFEIILLLMILSSFVLCYFSSRTWRIYNVVMLEFVFLTAVAFSYLAVRTLKTHQSWRSAAIAWQNAVDKVEVENQVLLSGKEEQNRLVESGIEQLKLELQQLAADRANVWFDVSPEKINPDTGACQLAIETPDPHEISAKMVMFVFEQEKVEAGGHYLGEFKVSKAGKGKSIDIEPNLALTAEQKARLKKSKGPWALYAMMPVDNPELFAAMDEGERRALLPKASLEEFASKERTLRDYEYYFHQNALECELLADSMLKTQADLTRTLAAEQKAQREIKYRKAEKADLTADLAKFKYERDAITKYAKALHQQLVGLRGELKNSLAATVRDAALYKQMQLKAAEDINIRTSEQAVNDRPAPAAAP